jgi:hypothetical protein
VLDAGDLDDVGAEAQDHVCECTCEALSRIVGQK